MSLETAGGLPFRRRMTAAVGSGVSMTDVEASIIPDFDNMGFADVCKPIRVKIVVVQGRQVVPVWVVRQWKKPLGFLAGLRKPGDSPWRRRKPDAPPRRKTARDIFKTRSDGVAEHGASIPSDFAFHRRPFAVELNGSLTPAN
ncbi:MAG: hypothetical protein ABSF38_15480, partial [Verrucomicrobiota bacterium]